MSHMISQRRALRAVALACALTAGPPAAHALQGDEKLACEAILCLAASGGRPTQCVPAIRKFFSISAKRFADTLRGRLNFLNLCPIVGQPHMSGLRDALVNGAGRCDAASINSTNYYYASGGESAQGGYVSDVMPEYCAAYFGNSFVQTAAPRYVGTPYEGGYWVEAQDHAQAVLAYETMRERERQEREAAAYAESQRGN